MAAAITAIKPSIEILAMTCDTTKSSEVAALFSASMEIFGSLDVVIVNVGTQHIGRIGEGEEDGWWADMTTNHRSAHLVTHHYALTHSTAGSGTFMSVTSSADTVVYSGFLTSGITKQAVGYLICSFPTEYAGLKAFEMDPGIVRIRTMFDMDKGFVYDSPKLAGVISVWLGSGRANHVRGCYVHVTWDIGRWGEWHLEMMIKCLPRQKSLKA
jgi:NAD(P)-dependent dehydrogenase (short-subunit alcohol dehydrogenase family)